MKTIEQFYDNLAPSYDGMTSFDERFRKEKKHFKSIIRKYKISSALDAGAGTGFHALLLSSLGVEVTAIDLSSKMLMQARKHSREMNLKIKTVQTDFLSVPKLIEDKFDAVFCLGNSLPHLPPKLLLKAFKTFYKMLHPHGIIVTQTLNYNRILHKGENIQNIRHSDKLTTIRYYDFYKKIFRFNVLTIQHPINRPSSHIFQSIIHYPIYHESIKDLVTEAGYTKLQTYGGIDLTEYRAENSRDIVLIAEKS
ncbi:MAG: class I SAM-dependent methyltransferase [Ignavibacteriales bacterium]|nr:class I SAM-dependent methyltransferase [Ignavibacteriales bacterium]